MARVRTAILISGGGSNMAALIAAAKDPAFPAEISLVAASNPAAGGLAKAQAANVPALAFDHREHDREGLERAVDAELEKAGIELVCLAGWMRLLSPYLIDKWRDRMINIHPSLLPAFKGLHTHRRALETGVKVHGCTVHFVRQEMDVGPIIAQATVPVLADDTEELLAARVLTAEHRVYPQALKLVASGAVRIEGERVLSTDAAPALLDIR